MVWQLIEPWETTTEQEPVRIYEDFFNLRGIPFSITPDPEFLYLSETHLSVFEKIQYGVQCRMGFMMLTGEVGTGKTTLCRALLDQLQGNARTVYVINPSLTGRELIACILEDLNIDCRPGASKKELIDRLNRLLLTQPSSAPAVVIIDDAQTMPRETLEDLRLLSNLETDKNKLLQILLVGQPELLTLIDQPALRQLKQRVAIHCRLDILSRAEVGAYIERRLAVAGNQGQVRFDSKAVQAVHKAAGGVPRMINKVCDLALTAAYAAGSDRVNVRHVNQACGEISDVLAAGGRNRALDRWYRPWLWPLAFLAGGLLILGAGLGYRSYHRPGPLLLKERPAHREQTPDKPTTPAAKTDATGHSGSRQAPSPAPRPNLNGEHS